MTISGSSIAGGARPAYYDRDPVMVNQESSLAALAPHGSTTRFTYTVPSGKKAYMEVSYADVTVITAAAPAGSKSVRLTYTPDGGGRN